MIKVILPGPLLRLFPDATAHISVSAPNVGAMLDELDQLHPGIKSCLVDNTPSVRAHINIFVDGTRADLDSSLPDNSEVYIFTAMSGG